MSQPNTNTVKCTINGVELQVKPGTTIIEAMTQNQQRIAHYCWHPGLSVAGVCRLCMVDIEGMPRVQIACNTVVTEGMKINNTSDKVKEAAKWGLDFHLINHPLDCPICDQAGECGLQDQYMEFGKYDPEMAEKKVKKHKVVDLGPTVVLDSERCILCSRCVRFTEEVSKTNELGIFNRGDRSEIGTVDGKALDNKYSLNTVDICPVGALTSKDFRFRQRVWYLKDAETICTGCSTGCKVKTYFNKEGFFRVKPVYDAEVNGHWMCDEGRDIYKFVNKEHRLLRAKKKVQGSFEEMLPGAAAKELATILKEASSISLVVTGQYTNEEYETLFAGIKSQLKNVKVYHWQNNPEKVDEFDGLLLRGDKNPNTNGLKKAAAAHGFQFGAWKDLLSGVESQTVIVVGPENQAVFPDLSQRISELKKAQKLVWLQAGRNEELEKSVLSSAGAAWLIPLKTFAEKDGTFTNHSGLERKFKKVTNVVSEALTLSEAALLMTGQQLMVRADTNVLVESSRQSDKVMLEHRKKNEFVFKRGSL